MTSEELNLKLNLKRVDELVSLRTNIIYVLIVITGGTLGLLLSGNFTLIKNILILLGTFYFVILISNVISVNNKIKKILYPRKEFKQ